MIIASPALGARLAQPGPLQALIRVLVTAFARRPPVPLETLAMNDTLLLVGHGSRRPGSNDEVEAFVQLWRQRHPDWRIELCFIELAETLLDAGARPRRHPRPAVMVLPLILNAASHVKKDIPAAIAAARVRHPTIEFACAPHLGWRRIFAIVKRRLDGLMRDMAMPDPRTTGVILLGRGSSDASANGDMARLARWVYEASDHELVDIAFTDVTHPRLESVVQRQVRLGMSQTWCSRSTCSAVLIERIGAQMARLRPVYPRRVSRWVPTLATTRVYWRCSTSARHGGGDRRRTARLRWLRLSSRPPPNTSTSWA